MERKFDLLKLLDDYIPASDCAEYDDWLRVGMALKTEGYSAEDWDRWSATDPKHYTRGMCQKKWDSFSRNDTTGATITQMAKDRGWRPNEFRVLDWDDEIEYEGVYDKQVVDRTWVQSEHITEPGNNWDYVGELIEYLKLLFKEDDHVAYTMDARFDSEHDKWRPSGMGVYSETAGELIRKLNKYKTTDSPFGFALNCEVNNESGAWIRFNPFDGKGIKDENVTDYRYALVECDGLPEGKQLAMYKELQLPCKCIVSSGGKSIHAIVKIGAASAREYRDRVQQLYQICDRNGLRIDANNKNPSRLSRMPGVMRGGRKQFIIERECGKASWEEWLEYIADLNDDLPQIKTLKEALAAPHELSPCLIDGVLRQGHKMLVAGPSKAGKSFLLMNLAVSIAEGREWLGWKCAQGKVLYVNLEIDENSCLKRLEDLYEENHIPEDRRHLENIHTWSLRGESTPMDKLTPRLIRRAKDNGYSAIIIDPIYKVITGDENSASEMANFCNQFDKIATKLKSSVIYCHHHSKGAQSGKSSMDRASGSGVFARDPDALLDILEMEVTDEIKKSYGADDRRITGWKVETSLREFAPAEPVYCFFDYPIHKIDDKGLLKKARTGDAARAGKNGTETNKSKKAANIEKLKEILDKHFYFTFEDDEPEYILTRDIAEEMDMSMVTIGNYLKEISGYRREVVKNESGGSESRIYAVDDI